MTKHSQPRPHTEIYFFDTTNTLENPNTQNLFSPRPAPDQTNHYRGSPRPESAGPNVLARPTQTPCQNEGTGPGVSR